MSHLCLVRWFAVSIAVALFVAALQSQGTATQQQELLRATSVDGRLHVDPPWPIDWELLAPRALVDFDIDQPDETLVVSLERRRNMFNDAEVEFTAPLPAPLQQERFYLISSDGIQEIRAERLTGTVRFSFTGDREIAGRTLFGYIEASALDGEPLFDSGFVLASLTPRGFVIQDSRLERLRFVPERVREQWTTLAEEARRFWVVARAYEFRFDGDPLARTFVQWVPDTACYEACCRERYSVLSGEDSPRVVASYDGGCDL